VTCIHLSNLIQEREQREQAEAEQAARERFDADQKKIQDEKHASQVAEVSAQKEANLARQRHDKALNLGPEPERGADVTHVCFCLELLRMHPVEQFGEYA
jgi:hypothetical protein